MKAKLLILVSIVLFTFGGCKKSDDSSSSINNAETVKTTLSGRVFDESGNPVLGAQVSAGSKTSLTDQFGIFLIEDINLVKERALVTISKSGYWNQIGACRPSAGTATYCEFTIFNAATSQSISSSTGGIVTYSSGATVSFPANAFATLTGTSYTGTVNVCMHTISADDKKFGLKVPGSDLLAINNSGEKGILNSYGMIGIKLTDQNGNLLKIADGQMAHLTFPIANTQQSIAPNSIPLWYFDESQGLWIEEGSATKIGNSYQGNVAHFSWWNCDTFNNVAFVSGHVLDCNGNPLPYAQVVATTAGLPTGYNYCDAAGFYNGIIPAGVNVTLFAVDNSTGNTSQTIVVNYPINSGFHILPYLQINDPNCYKTLIGIVVNCSNLPTSSNVVFLDSLNNYISYTYTPNGQFSMILPNVGFTRVTAYKNNEYGFGAGVVSNTAPTNVGNILLCSSISNTNNFQMTFTNSTIGAIALSYQVSGCDVDATPSHSYIKFSDYSTNTGATSKIYLNIPNYSNGNYNWNGNNCTLSGYIFVSGKLYEIAESSPSNGLTTITNSPGIGSNIAGSFSGDVVLTSPGNPQIRGTLSTTFNIYRNN